jgi:hypothetical protein
VVGTLLFLDLDLLHLIMDCLFVELIKSLSCVVGCKLHGNTAKLATLCQFFSAINGHLQELLSASHLVGMKHISLMYSVYCCPLDSTRYLLSGLI